MLIKRLASNEIEEAILSESSVVIFSLESCQDCIILEQNLLEVSNNQIPIYKVGRQKLAPSLAKKWHIGYAPRVLFFKNGIPVGRFYGLKSVTELNNKFQEFKTTGRVLSDRSDSEEECLFRDRVIAALNWNWGKDKEDKINRFFDISDVIFETNPDWSILTIEQIKDLLPTSASSDLN